MAGEIVELREDARDADADTDRGQASPAQASMTDDAVLAEVRAVIAREGLYKSALARAVGAAESTLSEVLSGRYKGDPGPTVAKLRRWLCARAEAADLAARMAPAMMAEPGWVETATGRRIVEALKVAHLLGHMICVHGGAGVGKTMAATRYRDTHNRVYVATASPDTGSVAFALDEVAQVIGLGSTGQSGRAKSRAIRAAVDRDCMIVIDEAQHLSLPAIEALRAIHDATGCALALIGNDPLYDRIYGRRGAGTAQIFSRIAQRVALKRPVTEDVAALARGWGLPAAGEVVAYLRGIAVRPGALRLVAATIRMARLRAPGGPGEIDRADLEAAWGALGLEGGR